MPTVTMLSLKMKKNILIGLHLLCFGVSGALSQVCNLNMAFRQKTEQSSNFDHANSQSSNAVNGDRGSSYKMGSCSATTYQRDPWWSVDLGTPMRVQTVVITTSDDYAPASSTESIVVSIMNSSRPGATSNCGTYPSNSPPGSTQYVSCTNNAPNRYVFLQLFGTGQLKLCEVEVYVGAQDVEAYSITYNEASFRSHINSTGCATSPPSPNQWLSWWTFDMLRRVSVRAVTVTNKGYGTACGINVEAVTMRITDINPIVSDRVAKGSTCVNHPVALPASRSIKTLCDSTEPGRYVVLDDRRIVHPLSICEIKIDFRCVPVLDKDLTAPLVNITDSSTTDFSPVSCKNIVIGLVCGLIVPLLMALIVACICVCKDNY